MQNGSESYSGQVMYYSNQFHWITIHKPSGGNPCLSMYYAIYSIKLSRGTAQGVFSL